MLSKYIFCSNLYKGRSNHSALSEIAKNSENTGKKKVCMYKSTLMYRNDFTPKCV